MHSRIISSQSLALLDTSALLRPSHEIDAWLKSETRWAVAVYREDDTCVGLLLAIKEGDHVVLAAFGSGFTWASAVINW